MTARKHSSRRPSRGQGPGLSRRQFLAGGGAALGGLALAPVLTHASSAFGSVGSQTEEVGGSLSVLNWPLYIDKKSLRQFENETGINLKYSEAFNDNNEFFAKYQEPLSQNDSIGADIVMPSSWMAERLIGLGYVQKLPLDQIPNAANLSPGFQNPEWDPTGEFTLPWQTGMSGLAYNIKETDGELTSVDALFDKKFKGKVGMLTDLRATMTLTLLSDGVDPTTVTFAQARPSFRKLQKAADDGQIRKFTGNDYQDELVSGDFAVCVGWSGDVAQLVLENDDLRFVVPEEGGERWADTMVWVTPSPKSKAPQVAAWMNYFYDQANAAQVEAFIQFISPVDGIEEELAQIDPGLATNPLIFPPEDVQARLKKFKTLGPKEEEQFDERFSEIAGA